MYVTGDVAMVDSLLREKYIKLLKVRCLNKTLRQYALDYYDNLENIYNGEMFTRCHFATLNFKGRIIEQDVVKALLATKSQVSAQEIFVYLFERNVKRIKFSFNNSNNLGMYYSLLKKITIANRSWCDFVEFNDNIIEVLSKIKKDDLHKRVKSKHEYVRYSEYEKDIDAAKEYVKYSIQNAT